MILTMSYQQKITMLRVTQIKGIRQKIPVSQLPIQQKERQIVTAIVGDSMVKDIYGWELSDNNKKSYGEAFQQITNRRYDEIHKTPLKGNPESFIIHVGTNDFRSNQDPETIMRNILEVSNNNKTDINKVLISIIFPLTP